MFSSLVVLFCCGSLRFNPRIQIRHRVADGPSDSDTGDGFFVGQVPQFAFADIQVGRCLPWRQKFWLDLGLMVHQITFWLIVCLKKKVALEVEGYFETLRCQSDFATFASCSAKWPNASRKASIA